MWSTSSDLPIGSGEHSSDLAIGSGEPDRPDCGSRIHSRYRRPCNRNTVLFLLFLSVLVVTFFLFSQPLASLTVFNMTLGFPGEGPKMPDQWVGYYERAFPNTSVEAMAREIVAHPRRCYKSVCCRWSYNLLPSGGWANSNNRVYKRLQMDVRKLDHKNTKKNMQRTRQMLEDANRLNVTTAGEVIKVQQERDNLFKR